MLNRSHRTADRENPPTDWVSLRRRPSASGASRDRGIPARGRLTKGFDRASRIPIFVATQISRHFQSHRLILRPRCGRIFGILGSVSQP